MPGKSGEREPTFLFLGGASCLDLTATMRAPRGRVAERLRAPQDLVNWLVAAGVADQPPSASSQDLVQARTLREAIYETIRRRMAGRPPGPGHLAIINNWAGRPPPRAWLQTEDGQLRARHDATTVDALMARLARDAVDLLGSPQADRIRECAAEDCALLFLDTSRAGKRRWCSMGTCGARDKMTAYRARRLAGQLLEAGA